MKQAMHQVCLLLGSNIRPTQNIPLAVSLLHKYIPILQASSVWETEAVGSDSPNFLNAALLVTTSMEAEILKEQVLHPLETRLKRVRTSDKNSPRTIDLDIILFDHQLLEPNLWRYAYCAVPVAEVLPGYQSDTGEYLKDAALHLVRSTSIWERTDITIHDFQYCSVIYTEQDLRNMENKK
jgi:2-amino-4-hydroxy-6-hydroxymethyldihydropteridine diphosphokinase